MQKPQVVIVSGGSRGLGAAITEALLGGGHIVATFSRSRTAFIEECQRSRDEDSFIFSEIDAVDGSDLSDFVRRVAKRHGRVDALVNNAAVALEGMFTMAAHADIHRALSVNLEAVLHLTQSAARAMLVHQRGSIVNVSSVNAVRGHAGVAVYSATKAALDGLTRSLARELGPSGIRVNSIAPGYFESDMVADLTPEQKLRISRRTPLKRLASVGDITGAIRFLLSDEAAFITGHTLVVDGGLTC
ncbi:MAG: glucose 1-dehydrogenase [Polyangiales bacterium]